MVAKETAIDEHKKTEAFVADLIVSNVEATKIGFSCLYDKMACDFPSVDFSRYTWVELMLASTLEDGAPFSACPDTPSLSGP